MMRRSQDRSIYSLNTQISRPLLSKVIQNGKQIIGSSEPFQNGLHSYLPHFFPQYNQFPTLSRILFLHSILQQNMLIISQRIQEIKYLWRVLGKKLGVKTNIIVIDQTTQFQTILSDGMVMLVGIENIGNKALNQIINQYQDGPLIIAVTNTQIHPQIKTVFSACFVDHKQDNFQQMLSQIYQKPKQANFNHDEYQKVVRLNFQMTLQTNIKSESPFLKPYLILLKQHLSASQICISHSKWKKSIKLIQFIAISKNQNQFKRLCLTDLCIIPNFLGLTINQINQIAKANQLVLLQMVNYYGKVKFLQSIRQHFWISQDKKQYYQSLIEKSIQNPTLYYACKKYPQTASIQVQNKSAFYRIKGCQKKLMSDKYIKIQNLNQQNVGYQLKLTYRTNTKANIYFGLACFDKQKSIIHPKQVCRKLESAIRINRIQGNKIYATNETKQNLKNWNLNDEDQQKLFAFKKCIGIYQNGQLNTLPKLNMILGANDSYSKQQSLYCKITEDYIELTKEGVQKLKTKVQFINQDTILLNHIEQGSYVICQQVNQYQQEWKQVQYSIKGVEWQNKGNNFLYGTQYVRVLAMINYNSGFPNFTIQNQQAQIDIKNITWSLIK